MAAEVQYYPSQMDPLVSTSTKAMRQSPLSLFVQDIGVLFKMLRYFPNLVLPIKASNPDNELAFDPAHNSEMRIQVFLIGFECISSIAFLAGLIVLPGIFSIPALLAVCGLIYLICLPLHGPSVCYSAMDATTTALAEKHDDEIWLFVNGCATHQSGLQKNINRLSKTFGRKIVGVHNQSFGLVADILECLVQRCFAYKTQDVRMAYFTLKPFLMEAAVKKVVLIGHSQGALIISLGMTRP